MIQLAPDNDDLGDGLPTMGEQYEKFLQEVAPMPEDFMKCYCGHPSIAGVMHRVDGPCYFVEIRERTEGLK